MLYLLLADIVVFIHFTFILFVIFGGLLFLRWRRNVWFHVPAAIWGTLIEFGGWICPLTPLENLFRMKGGAASYQSSFIDHYVLPIIYPETLTRSTQIAFGLVVLIVNLFVYGIALHKIFFRGGEKRS
jgi:Protein of Unknown function (DUF2784)